MTYSTLLYLIDAQADAFRVAMRGAAEKSSRKMTQLQIFGY
jgi:hypothetical protein